MSVIILENEIVHYEVLGRGRPVIFLHGWVGSWRYWIPAMQAASREFRTYALDFWGFGDTAKAPDRYRLAHQLELLKDFLAEMGMRKVAIVGHGLGALVGMLFASQHPEQVDRIMAISFPLAISQVNLRLFLAPTNELAEWLLGNTPDSQATRIEAVKADQKAVRETLNDLKSTPVQRIAQRLSTPCLLVFGMSDPTLSLNGTDLIDQLPPSSHFINFNQSAHFPMLDQPNYFNRLMMDFLALPPGESPRVLQLKKEWHRRVR